jgi:moderate conductance mechanosensitive channel
MTASERILAIWNTVSNYFVTLTPTLYTINLGLSLAVVCLCWGAAFGLRWGLRQILRQVPGPSTAEKHVRTTRTMRWSSVIVRLSLGTVAVVLIAGVWGLDLIRWVSQGVGQDIMRSLFRASILVILSIAAIEATGFFINVAVDKIKAGATEPRRAAQLGTLGPILRTGVQTAIIVIVGIMMLSQVGIQVGPLLAGAGVLGLAVGFGAQTLVKDFLTGFFLIVEDIVAVGDIVRIGDSGGQVEEMTLRTIRLRDFDGTLHVFPYSEAQVVHNLTKTFSYYVFNLSISYESPIDRALDIIKRTGAGLQDDANFKDSIIEPIEVVGVDSLGDSGVVLKARIKTLPIHQWKVGREFNRRIKEAFELEGIDIPYPHLKVVMPAPVIPV